MVTGRTSRRKGKAYEQLVARLLRSRFSAWKVERGWQSDGRKVPDVMAAGRYAIECKHRKSIDLWATLKQAIDNTPKGWYSVAFLRRHGGAECVVMPVEDWLELVDAAERGAEA